MISIDLNCDIGEGFAHDAELMQHISSANIACGFHAGDFSLMSKTVSLAKRYGVAIGAHPGFPDKKNFGRTEMFVPRSDVYDMVLYQMGALQAISSAQGTKLHHVKPHGALYNMAAVNKETSEAIVSAIFDFDPNLILYGLANSEMIDAAKARGLACKQEVFADRTYQTDGTLTHRSQPNAMIANAEKAIEQVLKMLKNKIVSATNGAVVPIQAGTICIHGDGAQAVDFAKALYKRLNEEGISISFAR